MESYQDSMSVIEMNKYYEVKVVDLVMIVTHEFSDDKLDMLSQATIEVFDIQKAGFLAVFYQVRVQQDFDSKITLHNKGALTKVLDGEIDKKTRGRLLIKLCFDARSLLVISAAAVIPTV